MENRIRFAPSPTGQVHIGNIRTAIFNWLFARHTGGKFLLRIEDTDIERSTREAIETLLDCMQWLGLDYDEQIIYQTQMRNSHLSAVDKMQEEGWAYRSGDGPVFFRIPWDCTGFDAVRSVGEASFELHPEGAFTVTPQGVGFFTVGKGGKAVENSACLAGFRGLKAFNAAGEMVFELENAIDSVIGEGRSYEFSGVARIVFERREIFFHDLIKGELSKPLDGMKDLIIVRSDGTPVFHIANVCDDITQEITHIVRGDDHVENTYRHIMLFHALGCKPPVYGHMPMIVNAAGKPFSKRDGDAFVGDFREKGYLPEALFNYLALLGWSPGDDREKMTRQEMIEAFLLERVKSSPAQFDGNKLNNMNGAYIAEMPFADFMAAASRFADPAWPAEKLEKVGALMQSRTKQLSQVDSWNYFFTDTLCYDLKNLEKQFKKPEICAGVRHAAENLKCAEFTAENIHAAIEEAEAACEIPHGKLFQPMRLAVSGVAGGAELDATMMLIGRDQCLKNIRHTLDLVERGFQEV
jgi:glutamyl-tRNA synthetase